MNAHKLRSRRAFTLIELMVVILVIIILAGTLFRMTTLVQERMRVAATNHLLERLRYAINEFHVHYGYYPPVTFVEYEYQMGADRLEELSPDLVRFLEQNNDPANESSFFPDRRRAQAVEDGVAELWPYTSPAVLQYWDGGHPNWGLGYRYGLISYLWHRDRGQGGENALCWYDHDDTTDRAAKAEWQHYLEGIDLHPHEVPGPGATPAYYYTEGAEVRRAYRNLRVALEDAWGAPIRYESRYPFTAYRLWSTNLE